MPKKYKRHYIDLAITYRMIACCNIIYKLISKIIANRLKKMFSTTIDFNQCTFVESRLLLKNVLLVKDDHKTSINTCFAIKLDITKAFDTVQYGPLYPEQFVNWIYLYISNWDIFGVSERWTVNGKRNTAMGTKS